MTIREPLQDYKAYAEDLLRLQSEDIFIGLAANERPLALLDRYWEIEDIGPLQPWER